MEFEKRNLPKTSIDDLLADIAAFAETISTRNVSAGSKVQATASVDDEFDNAMLTIRELDPVVENAISNDKPLLAEWRSARHIERPSRGGKSPKPGPAPAPPTTPPTA